MYGSNIFRVLRNVLLTGLAIVLPVFITLYIIWLVIDWIRRSIGPAVGFLEGIGVIGFFRRRELIIFLLETGIYGSVIGFLSELIAALLFLLLLVVIGTIARYRHGELLVSTFDYLIASIPGIGTVYQTLRRVGEMVAGDKVNEFEAVKLVQMFSDETYLIAFQTGPSPDSIAAATDNDDMMTLFVPMAPNPVTGGFLIYVRQDRVVDVDMSIDDAARAILTSGLATEEEGKPSTDTTSSRFGVVANGIDLPESVASRFGPDISIANATVGSAIETNGHDDRSNED